MFGSAIFSSNYPPYPDAQKLHQNPTLPVVDKEYNSSTTDKSVDFSPLEERDEENSDSEQSYV